VYCGKDGLSDFDKLHSHAHNEDVFLYAFDFAAAVMSTTIKTSEQMEKLI
jgi:hypothetical protein